MEKKPLEIEDIYLLHLTRGVSPLSNEGTAPSTGGGESRFAMFDYFDRLEILSTTKVNYSACLGLELDRNAHQHPAVSSQFLTLVSLKTENVSNSDTHCTPNPFMQKTADRLSDTPFLGLIMVSILPISTKETEYQGNAPITAQQDVDGFLHSCADELRNCVAKTLSMLKGPSAEGHPSSPRGPQPSVVYQVFHCVNSGDFCIAIRSGMPDLVYQTAVNVRESFLNQDKKFSFPAVECSTFTMMGLEYVAPNGSADALVTLDSAEGTPSAVSICVSGTARLCNNLKQIKAPIVVTGPYGLFGRYDVMFSVNLAQFAELYPCICANKFGEKLPPGNEPDPDNDVAEGYDILSVIKNAICEKDIKYISSSFQVGANITLQENPEKKGYHRKRQQQVQRENKSVVNQINTLLTKVSAVTYYQEEMRTCLYQLWDLWESYSSLRFQDDSFINGRLLFTQISTLLIAISTYLECVDLAAPVEMLKKNVSNLVDSLKSAINSISHFQKMILSMNQQSMQSPNYEVQLHADMEKYVVAYTEFSRRFLAENFVKDNLGTRENARQFLYPIIIMDVVAPVIQAKPLFLLPYKQTNKDLLTSNEKQERVFLAIRVPDSGSFGTLYETLPQLCHELSHNFRILKRLERNNALTALVMRKIAGYIVHLWISQQDTSALYMAFGDLENEFVDILSELLQKEYLKRCGEEQKTANIGALISNILFFLIGDVFFEQNSYIRSRPEWTVKQFSSHLDSFYIMALGYSEETPSWQGRFDRLKNHIKNSNGDASLDYNKTVKSLAIDMSSTICTGLVTHILKALRALVDNIENMRNPEFSVEAYKLFQGLLTELSDKANKVGETFNNHYIMRRSAEQMDRFVETLYRIGQDVWKKIHDFCGDRNICRECSLSSISELRQSGKSFYYLICDSCSTLKDAHHIFLLLVEAESVSVRQNAARNRIISSYKEALNAMLDHIYEDQNYQRTIHGAPQIRSLIAPLGLDMEHSELFNESLKSVLNSISKTVIETQVKDTVDLYREIFADLGMCVALDLDQFGYLRVLSNSGAICENRENSQMTNAKLERAKVVCQVLSKTDHLQLNDLKERLRTYYNKVYNEITTSMGEEPSLKPEWEQFHGEIERLLTADGPRFQSMRTLPISFDLFLSWVKKPNEWILFKKLQNIWRLVQLIAYLEDSEHLTAVHSMKTHFEKLYNIMSQQWQCREKNAPVADMVACVGKAYNDPAQSIFAEDNFKTTLSFVLFYYYHSWNIYGHFSLCDESGIQKQVDLLMGGSTDDTE